MNACYFIYASFCSNAEVNFCYKYILLNIIYFVSNSNRNYTAVAGNVPGRFVGYSKVCQESKG